MAASERCWVRRFVRFAGRRHLKELEPDEVRPFLSHLAVEGRVSASTQNQALAVLACLDGIPLLVQRYLRKEEQAALGRSSHPLEVRRQIAHDAWRGVRSL